ncbi:hypothetical protein CSAL01_01037 [Colletotrichum salicis]|uniref:Enoyl-CoA hydratase/isomerase n=1 Tax=Colletotrichum salicis TaxID=1209931 RepID=A0A135V539_9PEZI|nr:hypothetical protein CSAL01_01037 [Colletotrichum salicis]
MASSPNKLPESYTSFNYDGLLVSHVPASSQSVTKVIMITLNRPKKYNAMKGDMFTGLEVIFNTVSEDPRVRAVVITGAGKAFSGGADLDVGFMGMVSLKETEESMRDFRDWAIARPPRRGDGGYEPRHGPADQRSLFKVLALARGDGRVRGESGGGSGGEYVVGEYQVDEGYDGILSAFAEGGARVGFEGVCAACWDGG